MKGDFTVKKQQPGSATPPKAGGWSCTPGDVSKEIVGTFWWLCKVIRALLGGLAYGVLGVAVGSTPKMTAPRTPTSPKDLG